MDDEAQVKKQARLSKKFDIEDDQAIDDCLVALLSRREGRKLLWWLLSLGGFGRNPFTNNALSTSFNCGELNVSQRVLDRILTVNSAGYAQMIQEQADEQRARDQLLAGDGDGDDGDDRDDSDG